MALVTPLELVAIAKLTVAANVWSYAYSNGFETGTPEGATAGSAAIDDNGAGDLTLYTYEAVAEPYISVTICAETATPVIGLATVETQPAQAGVYAGCDPMKSFRVRTYLHEATATDAEYTIAIYRNPATLIA